MYMYILIFRNMDPVAQSDACPTCNQEVVGLILRYLSFVEIDHEIFSTVIFSHPLIQEGHLSLTGKRMGSEYWLTT